MEDVHGWSRGLRTMLLGRDPFEIGAIHRDLYEATIYHGRRGLGIHALSAVDVALHDLVGKQLGRPAYQLLGGACRTAIRPYATIYPGATHGRTIGELMDDIAQRFTRAVELGFSAVKMEVLFGDLVSDRELVRLHRGGAPAASGTRSCCWSTSATDGTTGARRCGRSNRLEELRPLPRRGDAPPRRPRGHAKLAARVETRVGGAEMAATRFECREWIERGASTCCSRMSPGRVA